MKTLVSLPLILAVSIIPVFVGPSDYKADYKAAAQDGKKWVIIISGDSCPYCVKLENYFDELKDEGKLDDVVVTKLHSSDDVSQSRSIGHPILREMK